MQRDKPAVGLWFAPCCEEDICQVESEDHIEDLGILFSDDEDTQPFCFIDWKWYDTRDELVAAIRAGSTGDKSDG